ncbi:MAG: hypothetical protein ACI3ZN_04375 [Candidatus Cryptobacteroides sp.]
MDVYLGKDIVDYGYDTDAFLADCSADEIGGILILTSEHIDGNLKKFLSAKEKIADAGRYSIWRL